MCWAVRHSPLRFLFERPEARLERRADAALQPAE